MRACSQEELDGLVQNDEVTQRYTPVRQDARKMAYIHWLTTPPTARDPRTEKDLAVQLDINVKTLYHWRHERDFREAWQAETDNVVGGDDQRQRVLETLYEAATDPRNPRHVPAAKLYLEAIGAMSPQKMDVTVTGKAVGMLTDDEIEGLIARGLMEQQAERMAIEDRRE
jgi:hypothetical protein